MIQRFPQMRDSFVSQVRETLLERWAKPVLVPTRAVAPAEADDLARATLDAMLKRKFRVDKLPEPAEYDQLMAKVRHWVKRGQPIRITLGYAPRKNERAECGSEADWAEFFALGYLATWHNHVQAVYSPGLRIKIVFDDSTARMANREGKHRMNEYIASVRKLIRALGYERFIVGTLRQSSFAWLFHFGLYQWAGFRVRRWEADPANQAASEQALTFARRNVQVPEQLDAEQTEAFLRRASHRYRVYWEALQLSGFSRLGKSLIAMYLDGSQHHIRQEAALHLATVGKEQVTQPWQGAGALLDNGKGTLVPLVVTPGRREKYVCEEVPGLQIIDLPGFDRVSVCRPAVAPANS